MSEPTTPAEPSTATTPRTPRQPRGKPSDDGRFIWVSSTAFERIVNTLGCTQGAFGLAVYLSLARLSSKAKNMPSIEATVQRIAGDARISYSKAFQILNALERDAEVIEIKHSDRRDGDITQRPNTYVLLGFGRRSIKQSARHSNSESADVTTLNELETEIPKETPLRGCKEKNKALASSGSALRQPPSGAKNNSVPGQPAFFKRGLDD
jgi:hypothetical protein